MFAELPKLFDRDFAIGYLLPMAVLGPCMYLAASSFAAPEVTDWLRKIEMLQGTPSPFEATALAIVLWLGATLLLVMNFSIIRLKEGYGKGNPLKLLRWIQVARFRRLQAEIDSLEERRKALEKLGQELDSKSDRRRTIAFRCRAECFPYDEALVLPTAFGNVIRAWEVYPLVMYGVDAIPGWDRLVFIIPESVRPLINQDKAYVDFWLNVWILDILLLFEYVTLVMLTHESGSMWALASIPAAFVASVKARDAAMAWGKSVKAAFDVYLPDLRRKLGLRADLTREEEREHWTMMSRAMAYRKPDALPPRVLKDADMDQHDQGTP